MSSECQHQEKTRAWDYCNFKFTQEQLTVCRNANGWTHTLCDGCITEPQLIITYKDGHGMVMTPEECDELMRLWRLYNTHNSRNVRVRQKKLENYFLKLNKKYETKNLDFKELFHPK